MRRDNYARQIKEFNEKKAKDKRDAEERKEAELAHQERLRAAEVGRQHQIAKEAAEQQRAMDEAEESQNESITGLSDTEENLILETALTKPSLCVSGSDGLFDQQDHEEVGVDVVKQAGNEADGQSENPPSLDSSLETVFGPGATLLAKELGNISDKKEEPVTSDAEQNSDSEVEHLNASTPAKDQRKKRVRKNTKFGELSSNEGIMDNQGASSEE